MNTVKIISSGIQPDLSESSLWLDLSENPNGGVLKISNGASWVQVGSGTTPVPVVSSGVLNTFGVSTGSTANAQIVTIPEAITEYKPGMQISYIPTAGNTSSIVSFNVNGVGPFLIKKANMVGGIDDITVMAILPGIMATLIFDGSNFRLQNPNS